MPFVNLYYYFFVEVVPNFQIIVKITQTIRKMIWFSSIATCSYKHKKGKILPALPQERERFTKTNELMKLVFKIVHFFLKTNVTSTIMFD